MGLTLYSKGSPIELTGGYGMFLRIRSRIAMIRDKELGEHYATISSIWRSEDFKEFDRRTNEILRDDRFKNEDKDLVDFLFASDCEGKCGYRTCKKIYDLIKDTKNNATLRYAINSNDDWEDLKRLLKDCYSHRANLKWN